MLHAAVTFHHDRADGRNAALMARVRKRASATPAKLAPVRRKARKPAPSDRDRNGIAAPRRRRPSKRRDSATVQTSPRLPNPRGLYAIHYSSDLSNTVGLPRRISAIVVQNVHTERQHTFSAIDIAQELGCPPEHLVARIDELERLMFKRFSAFARSISQGTWVHWGMRKANFGFDVIIQRLRAHRLQKPTFAERRLFDLSAYLKQRYGDSFAPHPRLLNAAKFNGCWEPTFLNEEESAAAWSNGEYSKLVQSLSDKVDTISDLYWRLKNGTFRCAVSSANPPPTLPPTLASQTVARESLAEVPPLSTSGVALALKTKVARIGTRSKDRRPCYDRDHTFLEWFNDYGTTTYHSCAKIRDHWNQQFPQDSIGDGDHGREIVKKGIQAALRDRGKL